MGFHTGIMTPKPLENHVVIIIVIIVTVIGVGICVAIVTVFVIVWNLRVEN